MKNRLIRAKNFAKRHQVAIIMGALAGGIIVVQYGALQKHWAFLDEKSLNDEFFASFVKK